MKNAVLPNYYKLHEEYKQKGDFANLILRSTYDAIITKTPEGIITLWNKSAEKMYGYTEAEVLGKSIQIIIPSEKKEEFSNLLKRVNEGEKIEDIITQRLTKDGKLVDVLLSFIPFTDSTGKIIGASTIHKDISIQKQFEEKFKIIFEAAPDLMIIVDADGTIQMVNEQTKGLTGYEKSELTGKKIETLVPERFRTEHVGKRRKFVTEFQSRKMGAPLHLLLQRKDGKEIPVDISLATMLIGTDMKVLAIVRDISDIKGMADYSRSLIDASIDPIIVTNLERFIVDANTATALLVDMPIEKLKGSKITIPFPDLEYHKDYWDKIISDGFIKDLTLTIKKSDNSKVDLLCNGSIYKDSAGNGLGVILNLRDISELIRKASVLIAEETTRIENEEREKYKKLEAKYDTLIKEPEKKKL